MSASASCGHWPARATVGQAVQLCLGKAAGGPGEVDFARLGRDKYPRRGNWRLGEEILFCKRPAHGRRWPAAALRLHGRVRRLFEGTGKREARTLNCSLSVIRLGSGKLTLVHGVEKLDHIISAHQSIFDQLRVTGAAHQGDHDGRQSRLRSGLQSCFCRQAREHTTSTWTQA